jgi:hypothetical protein
MDVPPASSMMLRSASARGPAGKPGLSLWPGRALSGRGDFSPYRRGERLLSKVVGWIIVILLIVWIITDPARAGIDWHIWATNLGIFFSHLAGCGFARC